MEAKRGASNDGQIIEKKMSVVGSVTRKNRQMSIKLAQNGFY